MQTVVIVQARMGSTRLPGKVMKAVQGRPLLGYLFDRLKLSQRIDQIVLATSTLSIDDVLEEYAEYEGVSCFRGSEHDVLSRYYHAAKKSKADLIVRITADCPLMDPALLDHALSLYDSTVDYFSNTLERSYPRGLDIEIFPFRSLEKAYQNAKSLSDREHVTPYLYRNPNLFVSQQFKSDLEGIQRHRWTVDEEEDFLLIRKVLEALYPLSPQFTMQEVLELFSRYPEWVEINAHINQKAH